MIKLLWISITSIYSMPKHWSIMIIIISSVYVFIVLPNKIYFVVCGEWWMIWISIITGCKKLVCQLEIENNCTQAYHNHMYPFTWNVDKNPFGLDSIGTSAFSHVLMDFVSFPNEHSVIQQNSSNNHFKLITNQNEVEKRKYSFWFQNEILNSFRSIWKWWIKISILFW